MTTPQIRPVLALLAAVLSIVVSHTAEATNRLLTIRVPKDYPTIQQAIDSSFDGDTILVSPGTYTESLNLGGREIEVRSTGGAGVTIVNPVSGRCLTAVGQKGAGAVLEGFTLTGGSDQYGGGVYIQGSSPTLVGCVITGNTASYYGGGMYVSSGGVSLVNCVVSGNTATWYDGGGIFASSSTVSIEGGSIESNTSGGGGGGVSVEETTLTLTDCVLSGNVSESGNGGGLYAHYGSLSVNGCWVDGNSASSGGGVFLYGTDPSMVNVQVVGNVASGSGGGVYLASGANGSWSGCAIESNNSGGFGGAMYVNGSGPSVTGSQVRLNGASQGGGLWVASGTPAIGGTLFCGNGVNISGSYTDLGGNDFQGQCDPFCDGDVNGDTYVNGVDLGRLFSAWGPCLPDEPCYADFNGDGEVRGDDLGLLFTNWGRCPGWE